MGVKVWIFHEKQRLVRGSAGFDSSCQPKVSSGAGKCILFGSGRGPYRWRELLDLGNID
jgi:hypothetical protein